VLLYCEMAAYRRKKRLDAEAPETTKDRGGTSSYLKAVASWRKNSGVAKGGGKGPQAP